MNISVTAESINELKEFAAALIGVSVMDTGVQKPVKTSMTVKKPDADPGETDAVEETKAGKEPSYTLEEVRAKMATLTKAGKRQQIQDLINSYGVSRLTEIPAELYPELMQKAGDL